MDKDEIKGKAKDVAGRVERQAGEWTGSEEHQAKGAMKQAEGKVQNIAGKAKDALRKSDNDSEREREKEIEREEDRRSA
jgi:uncharacterized protein YjbJ (UPF0337 family)